SAIIAGNPPKHRLRQLQTFWDLITERKIWPFTPDGDIFRKARNAHSCLVTSVAGQPGFFKPRFPNPWMSLAGATTATSYYDSGPLRDTLTELVDFSLLNERAMRFSVGAVNVLTGNFVLTTPRKRSSRNISWRAVRCRRHCRWSRSAPI